MSLFVLPFPQIDPVALQLGPLAIRWYGLAYVVGLVLGYFYSKHVCATPGIWKEHQSPLKPDHMENFLLWAGLGVILGGRLGFVLFYNTSFYFSNPIEIFKVWEGGMAFHGGLLGVIIAIYFYTRRHNLPLLSFFDVMAMAAPFGLFFGRIANFINGELYGRVTDVPWAMVFPFGGALPRHPSQLYEAALEGLFLWLLIRFFTHHRKSLHRPGLTAGIFGIGYGLSRSFVEFFREPDPQLGFLAGNFLTMGMLLSLPVIIGGIMLVALSLKRKA